MMPSICARGLAHDFDPTSGWCLGGCGWREDGRSQYARPRPGLDVPDRTEPRHAAR